MNEDINNLIYLIQIRFSRELTVLACIPYATATACTECRLQAWTWETVLFLPLFITWQFKWRTILIYAPGPDIVPPIHELAEGVNNPVLYQQDDGPPHYTV